MVSKKIDDADQGIDLKEIREFYDEVYYSEGSASGTGRIPRHYFRLIKRLQIGRGADVLDVASGSVRVRVAAFRVLILASPS